MTKSEVTEREFMSRQESRRLVMMGVALFVLLAFMVRGVFQGPSQKDDGVPVRHEATRPSPAPIATVRPSQDPQAARDTLEAWQRAERDAETAAVRSATAFEPSDERLQSVTDLSLDVVEEPGFYELLARVHRMTDAELARAPETQGTFTRQDLIPPPGFDVAKARQTGEFPHLDKVRGRFLHLEGRFLTHLYQRVLERYPNDAGLAWVWQGTFMAHNRGYFVTITDKEFDPKAGTQGTPIALTGAFLKLYSFVPMNAELGTKSYPHLIVKRISKLPPQKKWDYMFDDKLIAAVVIICVFALATYLYALRSRTGEARLNAWRRDRFVKRAKGAMPGAAAKAKAKAADVETAPADVQEWSVAEEAASEEAPAADDAAAPDPAGPAGPGAALAEPDAPDAGAGSAPARDDLTVDSRAEPTPGPEPTAAPPPSE